MLALGPAQWVSISEIFLLELHINQTVSVELRTYGKTIRFYVHQQRLSAGAEDTMLVLDSPRGEQIGRGASAT